MNEPEFPDGPAAKVDMETTVFHIPRPDLSQRPGSALPIRVEVLAGPMDGLRRSTGGDALTIGRGPDNDLCLPLDPSISSEHARIRCEGRTYWLRDLDSRNGTFLGEERLAGELPIGAGATFTVGRTQLQFMPR